MFYRGTPPKPDMKEMAVSRLDIASSRREYAITLCRYTHKDWKCRKYICRMSAWNAHRNAKQLWCRTQTENADMKKLCSSNRMIRCLPTKTVVYPIVLLHWYSCPDLLVFCARMCSSCSLLYSCLFPFSHLATASAVPISCVLCVRMYATNTHNKTDAQYLGNKQNCMVYTATVNFFSTIQNKHVV